MTLNIKRTVTVSGYKGEYTILFIGDEYNDENWEKLLKPRRDSLFNWEPESGNGFKTPAEAHRWISKMVKKIGNTPGSVFEVWTMADGSSDVFERVAKGRGR